MSSVLVNRRCQFEKVAVCCYFFLNCTKWALWAVCSFSVEHHCYQPDKEGSSTMQQHGLPNHKGCHKIVDTSCSTMFQTGAHSAEAAVLKEQLLSTPSESSKGEGASACRCLWFLMISVSFCKGALPHKPSLAFASNSDAS